MSNRTVSGLALLLLLVQPACEPTQEPGIGVAILSEALGGIPDVIENDGPGEWGPTTTTAGLDLEIGTLEGDPATVFGNIRSLAVDDAGRIYVLDSQAHEVRIFEADGTHVTSFGREGDGPGDLQRPSALEVDPQGNVVVFSHSKTYRKFSPDGDLLGYGARGRSGIVTRPPVDVLPDGRLLDWDFDRETILDDGSVEEIPSLLDNPRFDRFDHNVLKFIPIAFDLESGGFDTLPVLTFEEPFPYAILGWFGGAARVSPPHDGRIWVAWTDEYLLVERDLEGRVHRAISRVDARPPPVPDSAIDNFFEGIRDRESQIGGRVTPPITRSDIPSHGELLNTIVHDEQHIVVFTEEDGETADFFADVFRKEDGRYLGKVEFPVKIYQTVMPVVRDGHLYGVTVHERGYPQLVRLNLRIPPG